MKICAANDIQNVRQAGGYRKWVARLLKLRWGTVSAIDWSNPVGEVRAYIVRSNWVADCPCCPSVSIVQPGDLFYCPDCVMQGNGFLPARVIVPENRAAIERILVQRPDPMTRNWLLTETTGDLIGENVAHGIGIMEGI